jgi:aminopeptidase N
MSSWTEKKAKWGPIIFGSRISHFDFFAFQSIVYNKSSLVLNMLKDMLGEEVFFQGVREFFERNKYKAARTHNFVAILSKIAQQDLEPFFDAWFKTYTLPDVKVSYSDEKLKEGYRLKFHIVQLADPFIFPLWVEWIQDGTRIRKMIMVDKRELTIEFELDHKPKKIRINPDEAVPGRFH